MNFAGGIGDSYVSPLGRGGGGGGGTVNYVFLHLGLHLHDGNVFLF